MRVLAIGLCAAAAGCSQPPRSTAYFEAHPDAAQQVLDQCASGAQRGAECQTATEGLVKHKADERLRVLRKTF